MAGLALRTLLAGGLNQRAQEAWSDLLPEPQGFPSAGLAVATLRLEVRKTGIVYRSSLPQKLMATCAPAEATRLRTLLVQHLTEQTSGPSPTPPSENLEALLWPWLQVEEHSSGLLRLSLATPGVVLWLRHWNQCPEEIVTAALAGEILSVNMDKFPSSTAQRLRLHPVVLMQYLHARCYQLRQVNCAENLGTGATAESPALRREHSQPKGVHFSQADWAMLQQLIHLVDHLEVTPLRPEGLWKLGLGLAEATDIWLGEWPATAVASPAQRMILQGVERALFCFMKHRFGQLLPKSL